MNYKAVTVLCWWMPSTVVSFHKTKKINPTPITFEVRSIAVSKSRAPGACSGPTRLKSVWEWDWVDVWGWIECLCPGLIMLSTEWAHITKDLLSLAGELLQCGNPALLFPLPGTQKAAFQLWWVWQQHSLYASLSPLWSIKQPMFQRQLPLTGPGSCRYNCNFVLRH